MIKRISVIGAGTMGRNIALTFGSHGYQVSLYEPYEDVLNAVLAKIQADLEFMVSEDFLEASIVASTLKNITLFSDLKAATVSADYVIEAVPENMKIKQELFEKLDAYCPAHTVFATNTSSLQLTEMIAGLPESRKALCMVSHWYNPGHLIPIVELSAFGNMDEAVLNDVQELYVKCEKQPIRILKDIPGMIANRILHAMAREVFNLIQIKAASPEDVDKALMYGPAFRSATTGILETADMGGLDIWLIGQDNLLPNLCNDSKACDILRNQVAEGKHGLKNGKGFFEYPPEKREEIQKAFYRRLITQLKASKNYS